MSKKKKYIIGITAAVLALFVMFLAGIGFTGVTSSGGSSIINGASSTDSAIAGVSESVTSNSIESDSSYDDYYYDDYNSADEDFLDMSSYEGTNQKWVITVNLTAETKQYNAFMANLDEAIESSGGYVEYSRERQSGGYTITRYCDMTIRVPAENLDSLLESLGEGADITSKSRNMENITLQYHDTETRIKSLELEQEQLMLLLEQATTVDEIIQVQDRLTDIQYMLDNLQTTIKTYDDKVAFATVQLYVYEVVELSSQPSNFFERAVEGIKENLRDIREFVLEGLLWFVSHLPAILLIGLIITAIILIIRRRKHRKQATLAAMKEATAEPAGEREETNAEVSNEVVDLLSQD